MAQDFTVDRDTTKWVLGSNGFLKEFAVDEAAIEFNADGSYKGVLVEPASTNEAKASEDLDNATYWDPARTTVAGDTETDPKGGTNSFLLSETVDNDSHALLTASAHRPSIASGETWTLSIFVKKGDGANAPDIVQLTFPTGPFGTTYANFDISVGGGTSGTVTASSGGTAGIRYYGNGWYRISFTATSTGAGTGTLIVIFTNDNPTATRAPSYAGQTDANVFIWGAQLEESLIATSYIPTTTASVTRNKDDISLTSASSLIGQTEGTLYVEVDWQLKGNAFEVLLSLDDGSDDNRVFIFNRKSSNELEAAYRRNASTQYEDGVSSTSFSGIKKISLAYKTGNIGFFIDGVKELTSTISLSAFTTPIDEIGFGNFGGGATASMWIRAVALFTTRLSDAKCEALTTL